MSQNTLTGQVVLITGASSGIGWAAALEMSRFQPRLALAARRVDKLQELTEAIEPSGVEVLTVPCDVSDTEQCRKAVSAVIARWGRLDILINNAGISTTSSFHRQDLSEIESVMRTNYLGAAAMIHAALPHMLKRKRGHILNVASIAGIVGVPYLAAYGASKFALVGLTESLRREYYGTGVTFTALCPGTVDTPMAREALEDKKLARITRPKTARQVALKIISCCLERTPVLIYGDAPGLFFRLSHFFPRLFDWIFHQVVRRVHPLAGG